MPGRPGRPTKLSADRADDLVLRLASGASTAATARAVGVGERTVTRWLRDGLRDRVIEARAARADSMEALSEARLVVLIAKAAAHDWKAAA